jgi:hypothetical protein
MKSITRTFNFATLSPLTGVVILILSLSTLQSDGTTEEDVGAQESYSNSQRLNYHTAPEWTSTLMTDQHLYHGIFI